MKYEMCRLKIPFCTETQCIFQTC